MSRKEKIFSLRLEKDSYNLCKKFAKGLDVSMSEGIRMLLCKGLEQDATERRQGCEPECKYHRGQKSYGQKLSDARQYARGQS